ncbi:Os10g0191201 [Oryza sativa Japonica Group]|uniref:Os10g0191201 protein n=1 Tax=Oryza sativa subsp. japonica TaxID=39947 RepID=A0A0P0XSR2_ORYSJ|nr:Os10g0191201 [Oryza sativa Japonica Group]
MTPRESLRQPLRFPTPPRMPPPRRSVDPPPCSEGALLGRCRPVCRPYPNPSISEAIVGSLVSSRKIRVLRKSGKFRLA